MMNGASTEDLVLHQNDNQLARNSNELFICGVCMELMVNPTTLMCGHSFCRHCLAQWCMKSKVQKCPSCQSVWNVHPKVNITLRGLIESLPGYQERLFFVQTDENLSQLIRKFDEQYGKPTTPKSNDTAGRQAIFITGFILAVLFQMLFFGVKNWWTGGNSAEELLVHKPLVKWSIDEVSIWIKSLGTWTDDTIQPAFISNNIDGLLLSTMTEDEIAVILADSPAYHYRAVFQALQEVKVHGKKPPAHFWEFKALHPLMTLFLATFVPQCPRMGVIILYIYDYWHTFLPLIHLTAPSKQFNQLWSLYATQFPVPSWGQSVYFSVMFLFFPYIPLLEFILYSGLLQLNFLVGVVAIVNIIAMGLLDISSILRWHFLHQRSLPELKTAFVKSMNQAAGFCLMISFMYWFYNWIPNFVYNIWFYFNVFVCTYELVKAVCQRMPFLYR